MRTDWVDFRNEKLYCPYCKTEIVDAWEIKKDEGTYECDCCDKEFIFRREIIPFYTTYKKEE